eukprot:jgi/Psemu1/38886/gm1.38886_g
MSTGLHCEPPITYDSSFDRTKNKLATLKVCDADGNSQEWKVPIFSEEGGLEELLYCEEAFLIAANTLPLSEDRYYELFTKILCPEAQHKWQETNPDDNHEMNYPDNIEGYEKQSRTTFKNTTVMLGMQEKSCKPTFAATHARNHMTPTPRNMHCVSTGSFDTRISYKAMAKNSAKLAKQ